MATRNNGLPTNLQQILSMMDMIKNGGGGDVTVSPRSSAPRSNITSGGNYISGVMPQSLPNISQAPQGNFGAQTALRPPANVSTEPVASQQLGTSGLIGQDLKPVDLAQITDLVKQFSGQNKGYNEAYINNLVNTIAKYSDAANADRARQTQAAFLGAGLHNPYIGKMAQENPNIDRIVKMLAMQKDLRDEQVANNTYPTQMLGNMALMQQIGYNPIAANADSDTKKLAGGNYGTNAKYTEGMAGLTNAKDIQKMIQDATTGREEKKIESDELIAGNKIQSNEKIADLKQSGTHKLKDKTTDELNSAIETYRQLRAIQQYAADHPDALTQANIKGVLARAGKNINPSNLDIQELKGALNQILVNNRKGMIGGRLTNMDIPLIQSITGNPNKYSGKFIVDQLGNMANGTYQKVNNELGTYASQGYNTDDIQKILDAVSASEGKPLAAKYYGNGQKDTNSKTQPTVGKYKVIVH